jgi:hypothetical protein
MPRKDLRPENIVEGLRPDDALLENRSVNRAFADSLRSRCYRRS